MILPFQIYRHFKGNLYMVISLAITEATLEPTVVYMSLGTDRKVWTRSVSDFESLVPEGKENPTGQKHRFELVKDLSSVLSQCTTQNLIEELKKRPDSPFNELDVEGLNAKVVMSDYVVGVLQEGVLSPDSKTLYPTVYANSLEEAQKFVENNPHRCNSRTKIFKSVLVEVQSFD